MLLPAASHWAVIILSKATQRVKPSPASTAGTARQSGGTGTQSLPPEIRPGQSIELLKALHILTVDGRMNQDSRRKLKQVYHLTQFIEPLIAQTVAERGRVNLVDHGAGKSYLGFILHDLVLKSLSQPHHMFGIETGAVPCAKTPATTSASAERPTVSTARLRSRPGR